MNVPVHRVARVNIRTTFVIAAVCATAALVAPVAAAPGEVPGYRRFVELESARSYSDGLAAAIASRDAVVAGRAALALGRTEDARAAGLLKNASRDSRVPVRALAVYGYGLLAAKLPISSDLVRAALDDRSPAVRVAAADAASRLAAAKRAGAETLIARVAAHALADPDAIVRSRMLTTLAGWRNTPQAGAAMRAALRAYRAERNPAVRWHAAWTLRRAYAVLLPDAAVTTGLHDADETVRIQFVDIVARRGGGGPAEARIAPLLRDGSWRVREQALETIRVLEGLPRTNHLTAIPAVVVTPRPEPANTERALARTPAAGKPRRPSASAAELRLPLLITSSASLDGPMPGAHPRARITTTKGTIVLRLYPEWAPITVANFLALANRGYYDRNRWFRIVPDFVAQTGDPNDNGEGDAGYTIPAEENPLEQRTGIISMGLNYTDGKKGPAGPIRDSAGTQFYITLSPQLHLNRDFTVFGEVESGFATLGRLVESDRIVRIERLPSR